MSTSGGFTPAGQDPCPAPMTVAELRALRDGGTLRTECHYVVTNWTGLPNLTGPNLVELHATSPTALALEAKVFTPFDNEAWDGLYDIDVGLTGTMIQLADNRGNVAKDVDAGGSTVGSFPWGNTNFRDNYVEDVTITGWTTQTGLIANCRFVDSTVNMTGKTFGGWSFTEVINSTVVTGAQMGAINTRIRRATVSNAGAGTLQIDDSDIRDSGTSVTITSAATGAKTFSATTVSGGWVMQIGNTNTWSSTSSTFNGHYGAAVVDGRFTDGGSVAITTSKIDATRGLATIPALDINGTGSLVLNNAVLNDAPVQVDSGSSCTVTVADSFITVGGNFVHAFNTSGGTITINAGCTGAMFVSHQGTGTVLMSGNAGRVSVVTSATSTRGTSVLNTSGQQAIINQNGTGSASVDTITQSELFRAIINLNSTLAATPALVVMNGCHMSSISVLNITDPAGVAGDSVMQGSTITGQSTLNIQPGGKVFSSRIACGASVSTGAFSVTNSIVEGNFIKTATADNTGSLVNAAFDNWV